MINEVTISLHCGNRPEIVARQKQALKPLEDFLKVYWNNRIDRHPHSYDSYSELINEAVATSPTEYVILINDRTHPKAHEAQHMLELLDQGFAVATKYSVGFMAFSKELIRVIGWWDQRFYGGGYEDDDFVLRLRVHNLAFYESIEAEYDMDWKSPLRPQEADRCKFSEPYFHEKWRVQHDLIERSIPEERYPKWEEMIGPRRQDISSKWKPWSASILGVNWQARPLAGPSRTHWFRRPDGSEYRTVR
jgi:hypothetical protein